MHNHLTNQVEECQLHLKPGLEYTLFLIKTNKRQTTIFKIHYKGGPQPFELEIVNHKMRKIKKKIK